MNENLIMRSKSKIYPISKCPVFVFIIRSDALQYSLEVDTRYVSTVHFLCFMTTSFYCESSLNQTASWLYYIFLSKMLSLACFDFDFPSAIPQKLPNALHGSKRTSDLHIRNFFSIAI